MDRVARVAFFAWTDPYLVVLTDASSDARRLQRDRPLPLLRAVRRAACAPVATHPRHGGRDTVNYRELVKAVVDAYDGSVMLYVADGEDPLQTWQAIFPESFRPMAEMPDCCSPTSATPPTFDAQASTYCLTTCSIPRSSTTKKTWQIAEVVYQDVVRTVAGRGRSGSSRAGVRAAGCSQGHGVVPPDDQPP